MRVVVKKRGGHSLGPNINKASSCGCVRQTDARRMPKDLLGSKILSPWVQWGRRIRLTIDSPDGGLASGWRERRRSRQGL